MQQLLVLVFAVPLVALGNTDVMALEDVLTEVAHGDSLLDAHARAVIGMTDEDADAARHAHARARAQEQLAKLQEMHKKAEAAPRSMRGTMSKHILHKALAADEEMERETSAGVSLAQTGVTLLPGRRRGYRSADLTFPLAAAVFALTAAYCTMSTMGPSSSVAHTPFEGQSLRSKSD